MANFTLHLGGGAVTFEFTPAAAQDLQQALEQLLQRLRAVAQPPGSRGPRPAPQPALEYRHRGEVFLEVFCNPNIWPTPFAAKVLITVRDQHLSVATEADLSQLKADLEQYLDLP